MGLSKTGKNLIVGIAREFTGVRASGKVPPRQAPARVYIANHASHGDIPALLSCFKDEERETARPVAGADYWGSSKLRRFLAETILGALLVPRNRSEIGHDPIDMMADTLRCGQSLIVFPEGTRNTTDVDLLPFKSGIYNLALRVRELEFVPCWISGMRDALPKGALLPRRAHGRVHFGEPILLLENEDRQAFLARTHSAVLALKPDAGTPGFAF